MMSCFKFEVTSYKAKLKHSKAAMVAAKTKEVQAIGSLHKCNCSRPNHNSFCTFRHALSSLFATEATMKETLIQVEPMSTESTLRKKTIMSYIGFQEYFLDMVGTDESYELVAIETLNRTRHIRIIPPPLDDDEEYKDIGLNEEDAKHFQNSDYECTCVSFEDTDRVKKIRGCHRCLLHNALVLINRSWTAQCAGQSI
jgi:hypothetical protein